MAAVLWNARVQLSSSASSLKKIEIPIPPPAMKSSAAKKSPCTPYDSHAPWSQAFLDGELSPEKNRTLQLHLQGCRNCQRTLQKTREIFLNVEWVLPGFSNPDETHESQDLFARSLTVFQKRFRHDGLTASESFVIFFQRRQVRLVSFAIGLALIYAWVSFT